MVIEALIHQIKEEGEPISYIVQEVCTISFNFVKLL